MLTGSILFWLALPLPGYALARRYFADELESGLMGVIALSYFFTLALLSPVAIIGYVVGLPVAVLSVACVALWVVSAVVVIRDKAWKMLGLMFVAALGVELVIVLIDMILSARVGTFVAGDAIVHIARIRSLLDHGLSNNDPFIATPYFFPVYHTNLLHALYATAVQVTRCDLLEVWFDSLPWAKLMVYSGTYYMVWSVFGSRWAAWAATAFVVGVRGPFPYVNYPNQLCPYYFTPMLIGFIASAIRANASWKHVARVGACSIVIGQLHGLYVLFSNMAFGPVLGVIAVYLVVRKRPQRWPAVGCAAALTLGMPFILVSKWNTPQVNRPPPDQAAVISNSGYFADAGGGMVMRNPNDLINRLGGGIGNSVAWLVGIGCALTGKRRRLAAFVLTAGCTTLAILYFPPLCTFFLKRFGEEWILQRFDYVWGVAHIVLVPGAVAKLFDQAIPYRIVKSGLAVAAVFLGGASAGHMAPDDWDNYWDAVRKDSQQRTGFVASLKEFRQFLLEHVPPGETVLTDPQNGMALAALADIHILASASASNGVPDLQERKADSFILLDPNVTWDRKLPLMRKYHIRYFYPTRPPFDWVVPHMETIYRQGNKGRCIVKFKNLGESR